MIPQIAVIVTDSSRNIQWVNEDFTAITGYTLPEVIGKKPNILQGPKTEQDAIRRIRKGLESQVPFSEEITNYRKNGEEYCCKLVIHPIYDLGRSLTNFIAFEVDGNKTDTIDIPLMQIQEKYQSSSLKGMDAAQLYYRLRHLIREENLYLDPNLNLRELSGRLDTNTKYLSQVVNLHSGVNLQVFINNFRIQDAKKKLLQEDLGHLTLYGVAMQCGFKNKSTFYRVFKEQTGLTPMQFIKRHRSKEIH
jgi:PAS domain S-box-containing protein